MDLLKLGHIGDLHATGRIRPVERQRAMTAAIAILQAEGVHLTVLPGDIYEGVPTIADEQEVREYLVELAGTCPVAIAAGNHDPEGEIVKLGRLRTGADALSHRHPILATETPTIWDIAGFRIPALPHITKAQATANLPPEASIAQGDTATMAYVRSTLAWFAQRLKGYSGPSVGIGHFDLVGAVASNGESRRDAALALGVEDLQRVGASAWAANHIHREQTLGDGDLWYAGSVYHKDYGERNDRKAVIVATFDRATGRLVERVAHALPQTPMYKIEAMLTEDGWAHVEKNMPLPGPFTWPAVEPDAEIWVLLHYPSDRHAEYRTMREEAERRYSGARIEGRGIPVIERRSVEFASASGLVDSFGAWRRSEGDYAPPSDSLTLKLEETERAVPAFATLRSGPSAESGEGLVLGDLEFTGLHGAEAVKIPYSKMRGIIAVTGPNGSGKTTAFEASLGALTREFAYYGSNLSSRFKGGGYLAQTFRMAGHEYQSTIRVSPKGNVEAELREDGRIINDPKRLERGPEAFDTKIRAVVGTKEILELTVFARQADSPEGKQGFFNVDPAERADRIIQLTGNEKYEKAAAYANGQRRGLETPIAEARTKVDAITRQLVRLEDGVPTGGDVAIPGLRSQLAAKEAERDAKAKDLREADEAVRKAMHAEVEIANLPGNVGAVQRELAEKTTERDALQAKIGDIGWALDEQQEIAGRREAVDRAVELEEPLAVDLQTAKAEQMAAETALEALATRQREAADLDVRVATKEREKADQEHAARLAHQESLSDVVAAAREAEVAWEQAKTQAEAAERVQAGAIREAEAEAARQNQQVATELQQAETMASAESATCASALRLAEQKVAERQRAVEAAEASLAAVRERAALLDRVPCAGMALNATCDLLGSAHADRNTLPDLEQRLATCQTDLETARNDAVAAETKGKEVAATHEAAIAVLKAKRAEVAESGRNLVQAARDSAEVARTARAEIVSAKAAAMAEAVRRRDEAQAREPVMPPEVAALASEIAALREQSAKTRPTAAEEAAARTRLSEAKVSVSGIEAKIVQNQTLVAQRPLVEAAMKRAAELQAERDDIQAKTQALSVACHELQTRLDGLQNHERQLSEAKAAREAAERRRDALEADLATLQNEHGAIAGQIAQLEALRPELEAARESLERMSRDHAEWALIERGCGKTGLQALAIDECGPEIADLVNRILLECHGPRWTFGMVTQVEKAGGKGVKDRFQPIIYDRGEERDRVSGGEGAILDVAVRLALAIYNGRHSGRRYQVIWLDEAAQAVGVKHAPVYLKMLRLAMVLGGFLQILIISHLPSVLAMVDWIVRMRDSLDGQLPPAVEAIEDQTTARTHASDKEAVAA